MSLGTDQAHFSLRPISWIVAFSMLAMALLQAMPENWRGAIRYDRLGIAAGEAWRLLTGHFVHLGWSHFALNMAGLGLGTWLFGADRHPVEWLLATLVAALACGLGLWWFSPNVIWCVGLSGALHGLMIVGFGGWALGGERRAWWLLLIVIGKIAWEQFGGDMPWASTMAGGRVITDAHLWGAIGGALFLGADMVWRRWRRRL